jgi:hypothetical protein
MKNSSPKMKNLKKHGKMISFFPKGSQIKKVLPCHFEQRRTFSILFMRYSPSNAQ